MVFKDRYAPDTVPQALEATWSEWEDTVHWQHSTVPGLLMEEDTTMPLPLELLPETKY